MTRKTLEASIADRLVQLSAQVPGNKEAFENHLTILDRAVLLQDLPSLKGAIESAAREFGMQEDARVRQVLLYIGENMRRAAA